MIYRLRMLALLNGHMFDKFQSQLKQCQYEQCLWKYTRKKLKQSHSFKPIDSDVNVDCLNELNDTWFWERKENVSVSECMKVKPI